MKVIFLKDVARMGQKNDVKDIADGYARNFLIPRKLAKMATVSSIAEISKTKSKNETVKRINEDLLFKNLEDLEGVTVVMKEKANKTGHLFAGIHKEEIIPVILEQTHLSIVPDNIVLEHPIKEVGVHKIEVKVGKKTATFKLVMEQL